MICDAPSRYGWRVPPILLLASVLAAEGVSYVLVGSAGLYLYGQHRSRVGDIDAVPASGGRPHLVIWHFQLPAG